MVDVGQLLKILKVVFLLCLISICFFRFNFPSIKKFLDDEVIINESVEKHNSLRPPAITICPRKWKPESMPVIDTTYYENYCGYASTPLTTAEDYMACVTNKTYGFEEMVQSATRGFSHNAEENFTDARLWTWDLTLAVVGRCYTLNHDHLLQLNPLTDGILLQLVQKKDYYIYFSEPDFHFIRAWPLLTIPVTMVALHGFESNYLSVTLKMVRTEELNRPEAP